MRVPGQEFFVPANSLIAGMARSYGCPAITSDLASVVCSPSRMAITNHLATVLWLLSGMASRFNSGSIKSF
jgi:hypothetical protein